MVPAINPAAVLITGDLTDSKDPSGAGLQQEAEWKGYSELLDALHSAGIPSSNVVDVRGNHDGFGLAVPRGHAKDYFAQHSASAKRGNATDRVVSYVLLPSPKNGAPLLASTSEWLSQAGNDTASCPAVALLGVDFSEDPGLKNPLNFVGHADAELTRTIRSQGAAFSGCRPAIIAFGHYPLSTVDHRPAGLWASAWILGAFKHAAGRADAMQGAAAAISSLPATAYVSGHLHTAFGERMHHAHPAHADVLLDKNSKNTAAPTHVLAELETGAWKDDRRFRIASVDNGAFAFIDLYYVSNGTPGRRRRSDAAARARTDWREAFQGRGGWGVTPTDQTATVNDHIALITWPPDARLSPQPAVSEDAYPEGTVRAAVFPLSPLTNEDQEIINVTVVGFLPGQEMHFLHSQLQLVSSKMSDKGNQFWRRERVKGVSNENSGGMVVFSGVPHASVLCTATGAFGADHRLSRCGPPSDMVYLQVIVENGLGRPSTSPRVPAALRCRKSERRDGSQDCWAAPAKKPAPLNVGWLEAFMLQVNWPVLMHRVYLITWALGLWLLLLLPRRVAQGGTWVRRVYSSPLFQKYAVPQSQYPTWSSIRAMDAGMIQALPPVTLRARLSAALLWPGAALVLVASRPRVWFALVSCLFSTLSINSTEPFPLIKSIIVHNRWRYIYSGVLLDLPYPRAHICCERHEWATPPRLGFPFRGVGKVPWLHLGICANSRYAFDRDDASYFVCGATYIVDRMRGGPAAA